MNDDLMNAILSMDSYNRSYNEGIIRTGNTLGNYTIALDSGALGFIDGSSTIRKDTDVGFYAIAYQDSDTGEVTISYRGTDDIPGTLANLFTDGDYENGYGSGDGLPDTPQTELAFAFYRAVASALSENPFSADIIETGHSLGGEIREIKPH